MRKVVLTKRASKRLDDLLNYLELEWSKKVKEEFVVKFDGSINKIRQYSEIAPTTDFSIGLHKYVVTKQTTLYYRIEETTITILTIFDNRMNPSKLNHEL